MNGIDLISAERLRQVQAEGFDSAHDDAHSLGELSKAAVTYAGVASAQIRLEPASDIADMALDWPWEEHSWKPDADPIRNLVKAGALIAAEIDRLQRKVGVKSINRAELLFAIGRVLRNRRNRNGLTLAQLAELSKVSLGYISQIEKGRNSCSFAILVALCGALSISPSQVIAEAEKGATA